MRKIHIIDLHKKSYLTKLQCIMVLFFTFLLFTVSAIYSQSPAGLITNINSTTGHTYTLTGLLSNKNVYTDRTYKITNVPAFLNNAPFISTPNDDKANKSTSALSFKLSQSATVYIAYDPRATATPAWMSGFQKLSSKVGIDDPNITDLTLYSKNFAAGNVTLGGNLASPAAGALNMYLVIAVPQTQYNLTVTTSGNGTVTKNPNQASYTSGTSVVLTATPASGQQFTGWSGDASGTTNPLTVTMTGNKSITATFAPTSGQFSLTVTTTGNGTVTKNPNQNTYPAGTNVVLTATPGAGQQFNGWSGDASGNTNPLTVTVNSNKNITASFSQTSSGLITNISATTGHSYTLGSLVTGTTVYSDRTYVITGVPSFLNNAPFIKTANDDKSSTASSLLSFNLTQGATVYVGYDPRSTSIPAWLSSWQKLASTITINDPKVSGFILYSKTFPTGKVTLGGNLASPAAGALTNYLVAALGQTSQYDLTVNTVGSGTVVKNPGQGPYAGGTSVSLTATPAAGGQFSGWSGDATGSANPLTIVMDEDKSVTATFVSGSGAPSIDADPSNIYDNDVSGGTSGIKRTITVTNNGQGILSVSSINTSGTNTNQFVLSGLPAFPANISAGNSVSFSVAFNPSSTGIKTATININSNDPSTPVKTIPLRGLGTSGVGGANEPSLQLLLNLLEVQVNVGDDDIATTLINSNPAKQKAPILGDEVSIQKFQKAGSGNVTITPLAVFGPTGNNPVVGFGWYKSGNTASQAELFTVSNNPVSNGQSVNVNYSGTLSFDPASQSFGFYSRWPFFSDRHLFSEDNLNTFTGAVPHHVRVYPYKKNGVIVPNSYLVAFEENTSAFDYQDLVFIVSNVKKFNTQSQTSNAKLYVENTDGFPSNDHVVFSHMQIPWTRDSVYNANHDSVKVKLRNNGINPLVVDDLTISNNAYWKIDKLGGVTYTPSLLPVTIIPGGSLDLMVKFIANNLGNSATRIKMLHETLTISSNDDDNPEKQVFLDGLWQYKGEGSHEPYSHEIMSMFGFSSKSGYEHEDPDQGDTTKLKGDEIKPSYFLRADEALPVTVKQMSAYHGCCQAKEHFKWFERGTKVYNDLFLQIGVDGQTLLPRKSLNGSLAAGTFVPTSLPFGIVIGEGNTTDPSKNAGKKLGVRVYKALDGAGKIIPNTYLLAGDYLGTNVTNYDYNDNLYYVTNLKPFLGTVYYSPLNATPSDVDFGEAVLQSNNSMLLNISSGGKTYSNGSQDPPIVISSVVVTGDNASEFSADMPLNKTLNPQQATTINVKFKPTSQGLKIADLLIYYNNAKSPKRVPLYGIAKESGVTVKANFRINSGASSPVTIDGKTWAADNQYAHDNLEPFKNSALKQIEGTDDDILYLDEQSSNGDKKPFRYQIPLSNGTYYVRLHFAELYWGAPGMGLAGGVGGRVFSVKLENQNSLINFDPYQEVGGATAIVKNFPVTVTDGNLNIDFSAVANRPMVCALEVYSFSAASLSRSTVVPSQIASVGSIPQTNLTGNNVEKPALFPNPVYNNNFSVQFPAGYQGSYNLQLIDLVGRKYDLGKTKINGAGYGYNMKVNVSRLSLKPGVYFIKINSNTNKTDMLKLLIK